MTLGFIFWLLMILILVFGFWRGYSAPTDQRPFFIGGGLLLWILLALLGWGVFGFPIQGTGPPLRPNHVGMIDRVLTGTAAFCVLSGPSMMVFGFVNLFRKPKPPLEKP